MQRTSLSPRDENTIEARVTIQRPVEKVFGFYRLKNHRADGSIGLRYSVPGIRPGFCAESTGMLSYGHSGALARE
jgi:hypothetical protein